MHFYIYFTAVANLTQVRAKLRVSSQGQGGSGGVCACISGDSAKTAREDQLT